MRYIRQYNKAPKTIKWRYCDPTRRITIDLSVTVRPTHKLALPRMASLETPATRH
jgi:hypothetical protein